MHPPPRPNLAVEIRRLDDERDWTQRFELDLACHGADAGFEEFARRKAAAERRLTDDGHGAWFGAFDSGQLVATLGVVRAGPDLARYQEVQTHPESRGRGLAGTLVHAAGSHALEQLGATHAGDRRRPRTIRRSGSTAPSASSRPSRSSAPSAAG